MLRTSFGAAKISDWGVCSDRPWYVGQHVKMAAKLTRFTNLVVVMRDYGMFAQPHHDTLGGLDLFPQRDYAKNPPEDVGANPAAYP